MLLIRLIKSFRSLVRRHKIWFWLVANLLVVGFLSLVLGALITAGVVLEKNLTEHRLLVKLFPVVRTLRKLSDVIYLPYYFLPSKLPVYDLQIDLRDLEKLNKSLPPAYSDIPLTDEYKKEVSGKLYYQGHEYKVKVGYRGLFSSHWSGPQKSWGIKFDKADLLEGKKKVDLILAFDRLFAMEQLNNYRAKKLGVIAPDSRFVRLRVNGKNQGVYFEIEGWNRQMVEKNNERSGDVDMFGFNYNPAFKTFDNLGSWEKYTENVIEPKDFSNLELLIKVVNNQNDQEFWEQIGNILDLDKFYRWQINYLLMNSGHLNDTNLKLYFNNVTGKFEFIAWDVSQAPAFETVDNNLSELITRIFKNPKFLQERNLVLWDYLKDDKNLEDDLNYLDKTYKLIRVDVYKDWRKVKSNLQFDWEVGRRKQMYVDSYKRIQEELKKSQVFAKVYTQPDDPNQRLSATLKLEIFSFSQVDFEKMGLKVSGDNLPSHLYLYQDKNGNQKWDGADQLITVLNYQSNDREYEAGDFKLTLWSEREPVGELLAVKTTAYYYFLTLDLARSQTDLKIEEVGLGLNNYFTKLPVKLVTQFINEKIFYYFDQINDSLENFLNRYPIFSRGGDNLAILPAGTYSIAENIIVPKGLILEIKAGAKLYFYPGISLISYGPVRAEGTAQNPITFKPAKDGQPWGTVTVVGKDASGSLFDFCQFELGKESFINGVYSSGQLNIHEATATVTNCRFSRAKADDSLNIKDGGNSLVGGNEFLENSFDAIDFDFTDGKIESNYFYKNGNDGIDISGAWPEIAGNVVNSSGDKCISLGEKTKAVAVNNLLVGCVDGIAVKDLSEVKIINNTIVGNEVGIALYEKKPIFGGGKAEVFNSIIWGNKKPITLDKKSQISVSYSDVEGGYSGQNNFNQKPIFVEPENLDYRLSEISENEALLGGGNLEVLREWEPEASRPIIGIYSLRED